MEQKKPVLLLPGLLRLWCSTGETVRSYPAGGSSPAVAGGMVYTIGQGRVYAIGQGGDAQ